MKKGEEEAPSSRPEPGVMDPKWTYIGIPGRAEYSFDVYRGDGSDEVYFVDPRWDPKPYELEDGSLDLGFTREGMTYMRDLFTYLLENWGKPETRESHPEEEEQ